MGQGSSPRLGWTPGAHLSEASLGSFIPKTFKGDGKGPGTQVIVAPTGAIRGWSRKQLCHVMRMLQTRGSGPEIPSRPQCPSSLTVLNLVTPLMLSLCSPISQIRNCIFSYCLCREIMQMKAESW